MTEAARKVMASGVVVVRISGRLSAHLRRRLLPRDRRRCGDGNTQKTSDKCRPSSFHGMYAQTGLLRVGSSIAH